MTPTRWIEPFVHARARTHVQARVTLYGAHLRHINTCAVAPRHLSVRQSFSLSCSCFWRDPDATHHIRSIPKQGILVTLMGDALIEFEVWVLECEHTDVWKRFC